MVINKFIIFLDVDGVLNQYPHKDLEGNIHRTMSDWLDDGYQSLDSKCIKALNHIIDYFNADLCMISAWNSGKYDDLEKYRRILERRGVKVNKLFVADHIDRINGIKDFFNENKEYNTDNYLIIEDESYKYFENHFNDKFIEFKRIVATNPMRGLDEADAIRYIRWNGDK